MAEVVGGLWIRSYSMTRSFGVEPGSASGTGVLPAGSPGTGLVLGDYVVYSFAGLAFYGLLSSLRVTNERTQGQEYSFSIVDNRIRLRWMLCFGEWNAPEERNKIHARILPRPPAGEFSSGGATGSDSVDFSSGVSTPPATPGVTTNPGSISRGRVYGHIPASQWAIQLRSYTDAALSARDIIRNAAKYALGGYGFQFSFHSGQAKPVFDVDANSGTSMAALLEQITSAQGLQMTIDGARTLRWERRGEGTLVIPPPPVHLQDDGLEMSADATKVRIVGDRMLVQLNNISLEADWNSGWEDFISEPAWLDEVADTFDLPTTNRSEQAELAARSREITVRQYISEKGNSALPLADYGTWDQVSRMNMPVWRYLNDIVFRSYRIPEDKSVFGIPLRALEIHESLLCATAINSSDDIVYRPAPLEFYPQASAYVIACGQPLDMLNLVDRKEIVSLREKDLSKVWSEIANFSVDAPSHSIRFSTAVFKDGNPLANKSILLFPNLGEGGYEDISTELDEGDDWLPVVLPNPNYVITPAQVKVSLVFRLGKYFKDFGTGQRWKPQVVPNIAPHLLLRSSGDGFSNSQTQVFSGSLGTPSASPSTLLEILYEDGKSADELAEDQAEGIIQKSGTERGGRYVRHGGVGTSISGVIDRVTTTLDWDGGVKEVVEFSKPRPSSGFTSSRDFARRVMTDELFGGQKDLQRKIQQLRGISKLDASANSGNSNQSENNVITDIYRKPIGGENPTVKTYFDKNNQFPEDRIGGGKWRAGDLLWLDSSSLPSRTGTHYGGTVVANTTTQHVVAATGGKIPTAVAPGTDPAESVMANPGDWFGSNSGSYPIGMLAHGSPAPGTGDAVLGLVNIGAGGGGSSGESLGELALTTKKPSYLPAGSALAEGMVRFYFTWGSVNSFIAQNWDSHFDFPSSTDAVGFFAIISISTTGGELVQSWEITTVLGNGVPAYAGYTSDGSRPATYPIRIGFAVSNGDGSIKPVSGTAAGSIKINEYANDLTSNTNGETVIKKSISWIR